MNTKKGLIFRAVPDSGKIKVSPDENGGVKAIWPNCCVLPQEYFSQLEKQANTLWYPRKSKFSQKEVSWVVNTCADADEYSNGLVALSNLVKGKNIPVFNHPDEILKTRRDIISEQLSNIKNLVVPKCVRFHADSPEVFVSTFEKNDFNYPVIVRPATSQTGLNLIKIDNENEWDKVHSIPWGGTNLYMTQFVDVISEDKFYRKLRFTFVNNKVLFRSMFQKKEWDVHIKVRRTPEIIQRKLEYQKRFETWESLKEILETIQNKIKLDFWGIDIGFLPNGSFVFFEANAAMSIAIHNDTPVELREMMEPILGPVFANLRQSLSNPASWKNNLKVYAQKSLQKTCR